LSKFTLIGSSESSNCSQDHGRGLRNRRLQDGAQAAFDWRQLEGRRYFSNYSGESIQSLPAKQSPCFRERCFFARVLRENAECCVNQCVAQRISLGLQAAPLFNSLTSLHEELEIFFWGAQESVKFGSETKR
jgi:hypothetical protein